MNEIPFLVFNALLHVASKHPEVKMVVFNKEGQWHYMDENFNAPVFGNEIDVNILNDAVDGTKELPCVYQI